MSTPRSELNTLLSQRGPSALPYTEDLKYQIRNHLLSLSAAYPSLLPLSAAFTHNDGRTTNLLQSHGTIPITFNNSTYNIPIIIWLLETYPRHAPLVFVNPTRDMVIKRNHPFVNASGVVKIPYLDNWIFPSSNLVELGRNLAHFFGLDPPLYSRPRPNPNPNYTHSPSSNNNSGFLNSSGNLSPQPSISNTPRPYPPSPYGSGGGGTGTPYGSGVVGGGKYMDDASEVFKRNAINKLVEGLYGDMGSMRKVREGEMEGLFSAQGVLRQRENELANGVKEMMDEKERLEERLRMVAGNGEALEGWLRENEGKVEVLRSVDVDDAFEHCDGLSKQMFECTSADLAMEDVIYALDKAVQDGAVPFDRYLRNVRMLAREQFIHRATASKVRAVQMQNQVSNMASGAPAYAL
ncbi:ubiquitin-protein ligase [Lithospermum erythrorhizon]|uniref:Ubiquitin-protein ligase n=1 Tax=Lithospermum erythrorhizon TaxID=34254 RepID=A0AAV3NKT1_LITER